MKILVCTDGSQHSQRALEEASKIAGGCSVNEVDIIHVYNRTPDYFFLRGYEGGTITQEEIERFKEMEEKHKEEKKQILAEALEFLKQNNINARTIFEEGHPAEVITRVAAEGKYDMIVMGSRGLGGLKKLFLGSVSSAVVQEAKASVLTVK